ncbi:MAG: hypothetical protein K6E38_07320 [Fretibacterium sp.]|nr:hypothetical protein [Fretibacterium sp.]
MSTRIHLITASVVLFLGAVLCVFVFYWMEPHFEEVNAAYVKEHTGKPGFLLVDVRDEDVFNGKSPFDGAPGGHIAGAVNFPGSRLELRNAEELLKKSGLRKDVTLILYCNAGLLSSSFAEALVKEFEFDASMIKSYKEGTLGWVRDPANKLLPEDHELGK